MAKPKDVKLRDFLTNSNFGCSEEPAVDSQHSVRTSITDLGAGKAPRGEMQRLQRREALLSVRGPRRLQGQGRDDTANEAPRCCVSGRKIANTISWKQALKLSARRVLSDIPLWTVNSCGRVRFFGT